MDGESLRHGKGKQYLRSLQLKPHRQQVHQGLLENYVDRRVGFQYGL